jgi:hypothetical protein
VHKGLCVQFDAYIYVVGSDVFVIVCTTANIAFSPLLLVCITAETSSTTTVKHHLFIGFFKFIGTDEYIQIMFLGLVQAPTNI